MACQAVALVQGSHLATLRPSFFVNGRTTATITAVPCIRVWTYRGGLNCPSNISRCRRGRTRGHRLCGARNKKILFSSSPPPLLLLCSPVLGQQRCDVPSRWEQGFLEIRQRVTHDEHSVKSVYEPLSLWCVRPGSSRSFDFKTIFYTLYQDCRFKLEQGNRELTPLDP